MEGLRVGGLAGGLQQAELLHDAGLAGVPVAEGGAHAAGAVAAGSVAAMPTMAVSRNEIRFGRRCIGSPFLD